MSSSAIAIPSQQNSLLANWWKAAAIYKRDSRIAFSYDLAFIVQWMQIVVQVIGFYFMGKLGLGRGGHIAALTGGDIFTYWLINLGFARFQLTAVQAFQTAMRGDQMLGTLECVLVTPTGLPTVVLSTGLWGFTLTAMQCLLYVILGALLGVNFLHTNLLTTLVFVLLTIGCMSPLGVMAAATIMTFKQNAPTQFVAGSAANLLGGVLFPVAMLPHWLQLISWCLPITHSLEGIRLAVVRGASLADPTVAQDALWLLVATAILMPISLLVFRRAVELARRDGTLGHY
jgi:ABC-2 type transport system permease protein